MGKINIRKLVVGFLDTNCYLVSSGSRAVLVDPGDGAERILKELEGLKLKLEKIILTHLHFDHIIAVKEIKAKTGAKIYCHRNDLKIVTEKLLDKESVDGFLKDGDIVKIQNIEFKVVFTPGHTPGGICLYDKKEGILFSGDTIFAGSIGVTNYPGGDFSKLKNSIEKKLLTLPPETLVYPGHYREFVLGSEKEAIRSILNN